MLMINENINKIKIKKLKILILFICNKDKTTNENKNHNIEFVRRTTQKIISNTYTVTELNPRNIRNKTGTNITILIIIQTES